MGLKLLKNDMCQVLKGSLYAPVDAHGRVQVLGAYSITEIHATVSYELFRTSSTFPSFKVRSV